MMEGTMDNVLQKLMETSMEAVDSWHSKLATDFHTRNTVAFVGEEEVKQAFLTDKRKFTSYRDIGKKLGLALCYGGTRSAVKRMYPNYNEDKCQSLVDNFFTEYSVLKKHLEESKQYMKTHGYITTILGRKIYIEGWNYFGNDRIAWAKRHSAENASFNYPIQGAGAEIIRIILSDINDWFEAGKLNSFLTGMLNRSLIKRILTIDEESLTDELEQRLNEQPSGHCLILVLRDNKVVKQFHRLLQIRPSRFKELKVVV